MKIIGQIFLSFIIYLLLCAATFLMIRTILQYTALRDDVGFLLLKQAYVGNKVWKVAFYVHVFSAIFSLMAGFTQFAGELLKERPLVHRVVGRLYAWNIIVINFPAGMIMAYYANGLLPSRIAFTILDCLWCWFTWQGVAAAKRGDIAAHRRFMIRSYALTLSAITLRSWKEILSHSFDIDPLTLYMIDAWLGFVPNLLLAEGWIYFKIIPLTAQADKRSST